MKDQSKYLSLRSIKQSLYIIVYIGEISCTKIYLRSMKHTALENPLNRNVQFNNPMLRFSLSSLTKTSRKGRGHKMSSLKQEKSTMNEEIKPKKIAMKNTT